jgi:two-component sensor histidine kinase
VDLEGRSVLTGYNRSPLSGWTVLVWVPKDLLQKPAEIAKRFVLLAGAGTLILSLLLARLLARTIERPMADLLRSADAIGRDPYMSFPPSRMREANVVGRALEDRARNIELVLRDLSHRTKNALAVVAAVVRQTACTTSDPAAFQARVQDRLHCLARCHDLLVRSNCSGVDLERLARAQLEGFLDGERRRLLLGGPPVTVDPAAAQAIGMALHELATNASKYGALSRRKGQLNLSWEIDTSGADPRFRMRWEERGGTAVAEPDAAGMGREILVRAVESALRGSVTLQWLPAGLVWSLDAPVDHVAAA